MRLLYHEPHCTSSQKPCESLPSLNNRASERNVRYPICSFYWLFILLTNACSTLVSDFTVVAELVFQSRCPNRKLVPAPKANLWRVTRSCKPFAWQISHNYSHWRLPTSPLSIHPSSSADTTPIRQSSPSKSGSEKNLFQFTPTLKPTELVEF